jgi:hypothetical protein
MRLAPVLGAAFALTLACGAARADGRLAYATDGACPVLFRSIEVSGPRLRFEVTPTGGEEFVNIFDGDEDLSTSLIPSQRAYLRVEVDADAAEYSGDVTSSMVKYMDNQLARTKAQMAEQMKDCGRNCPQMPDLDAMMRAAMPQQAPIEARDTGEAGAVDGVACTWREWVQSGAVVRRECLAKFADLPLPDADRRGLVRGMRVLVGYGEAQKAMVQRFGMQPEPQPPVGQVAIEQVCLAGGAESGRAKLIVVETPIAPSQFEIPAGYSPVGGAGAAQ